MKWRSAPYDSGKMTFAQMIFRQNDVLLNDDSEKCRSALRSFGNSTIRLCEHSVQLSSVMFFSARQRFGGMTFRQNYDSVKWHFGRMVSPPPYCIRYYRVWKYNVRFKFSDLKNFTVSNIYTIFWFFSFPYWISSAVSKIYILKSCYSKNF